MTTAVALTRQGWRKKITEAWQELTTSTVEGIIKVGNLLTKAKANLPHGEWLKLIEKELPITRSTTARFIKIANDERITNVAHALHLPPSWDTLYQLTRLNDKTFDRLLTKGVIRPDLQRNEITRVHNIEMRKKDEARVRNLEPIEGAFKTLIIDPPWDYEWLSVGGASAPKYATMTHEQLLAMPVPAWAERDCHMYLWTTNNFMTRAVDLMQHWGFQHKTVLTWIKTDSKGKPKIGLGTYFRNTTEQVLFGVRGELRTRTAQTPTHFFAPVGKHSEKPEKFYDIVRKESHLPAGEAFQRQARKGFTNLYAERLAAPRLMAAEMIEITLPQYCLAQAQAYAEGIVLEYANGNNEASRKYTIRGADKNPIPWKNGKLAEMAVGQWCGKLGAININPKREAERNGIDLTVGTIGIDVKHTSTRSCVWSAGKTHPKDTLPSKAFRIFVCANADFRRFPVVQILVWVGRQDFMKRRTLADGTGGLDKWTQYLEFKSCHAIQPGDSLERAIARESIKQKLQFEFISDQWPL